MLKKIRITLASFVFIFITLLFLDFTGTIHAWLGWLAKIQFVPTVLAVNIGVVVGLIILTLLFGRVYCSLICPLGILQDGISWVNGKRKKKNKFRFSYSPALTWVRYSVLGVFVIALMAGVGSIFALLDPYGSFGRIAQNLFAPFWGWGNNLLAYIAQRSDSYALYETKVWIRSLPTFIIATTTFILLIVLAWRNGRSYCNTICPVGTILGLLSKHSLFRIVINPKKCTKCSLCARGCKAACINYKEFEVDNSRCVTCMNCLGKCKQNAIGYKLSYIKPTAKPTIKKEEEEKQPNESRRNFLILTSLVTTTSLLKAQEKASKELAIIANENIPTRRTPPVPAGALSLDNMAKHCTACQLCVSVCPSQVLRPSSNLKTLMQPEMSFERGYCDSGCVKCSEVCPTKAITKITSSKRSITQIGQAVFIIQNCSVLTENIKCEICASHCPEGAIIMVSSDLKKENSSKIPFVNTERCIGCGACENLCPAKPLKAIYVEGNRQHLAI